MFLTSGERGIAGLSNEGAGAIREAEARKAGEVLGLDRMDFLRLPDLGLADHIELGAQLVHQILESQSPGLIYLPHLDDTHPDHQAALPIVRAALSKFSDRTESKQLILYEVWSPMTHYGWAEDISRFMRQKLRAVRCYKSQLQSFRYDRAIRGLNQYRGGLAAGSHYAEVFQYAPSEPGVVSQGSRTSGSATDILEARRAQTKRRRTSAATRTSNRLARTINCHTTKAI